MAWDLPAGVDWPWLIGCVGGYALVLARVLGLCLTAPGLAVPGLDWRFRLGLAVVLGSVLVPVVGTEAVPPANLPGVLWAGFAEIVTGGLMGLT
ncbi:MAG: flagellar biosynthetic protein FliR, partial [Isosphaeraceae bacterium]